jgi:hypothetical protein
MELYTSDFDVTTLTQSATSELKFDGKKQARRKALLKKKILRGEFAASTMFETSREIRQVRESRSEKFESVFAEGVRAYISGDWGNSKRCLDDCMNIKPRDGPTSALINVMSETGFNKPSDWEGYRVLTEK